MTPDPILETVTRYYAGKLAEHGPTARGVDWNSQESQFLRFEQLLKVVAGEAECSLNDYGCGYGSLAGYLHARGWPVQYTGYDAAARMIDAARAQFGDLPQCAFTADRGELRAADFTVASGVFNVKLETPTEVWAEYVLRSLDELDALSRRGFAFNALTRYSDAARMRPDLYYADPCALFDHCKTRYSRRVALLHDYPLWEFTLLVRKG